MVYDRENWAPSRHIAQAPHQSGEATEFESGTVSQKFQHIGPQGESDERKNAGAEDDGTRIHRSLPEREKHDRTRAHDNQNRVRCIEPRPLIRAAFVARSYAHELYGEPQRRKA
jgi:hypothetical protein